MSSLQTPAAPGEPTPPEADSFERALAAGRRSREGQTPDWPPWMAPVALFGGIVVATVGGLVIDLPALALGVKVTSSHTPPGLLLAGTVVQDVAFVLVAVYCAGVGGRTVRSGQFGLHRPGVGWVRASGLIVLLLLAVLVLSATWTELVHPGEDKLLNSLGSNEGTLLLLFSAVLTCVVAPIGEEFLFRGFIFTALRNWKGTWPAAILTGVLFGGVHFESAPLLDLAPLAALGFGLCLLYRYTGSLYPSIIAHSINNSIAFSGLEKWSWQAPVLMLSSLALIGAIVLACKRVRLITTAPAPPSPTPAVFST